MLTLDGSFGEGGGQILRTAVALSAIKGVPIKVGNIRANRPNPGLQAQHIACIKAVGMLCNAKVEGLDIGSKEISFTPRAIKAREISLDVGTAGSITLVLQALFPAVLHAREEFSISIKGGTDVSWSPPVDYMRFVLTPMLKKFGYNLEVNLVKRGYYPSGNGLVEVSVKPGSAREINMVERGKIEKISGISHAHKLLEGRDVAGRQKKNARLLLFNELSSMNIDCEIKLDEEYCETLSVGSGLTLWAECENAVLGGSALGSKNKRAEEVGLEAGRMLLAALKSKAPVDVHMADQLIPYLALNGGALLVPEVSNHAKTNMHVVNQFGFNLKTEGNVIKS